MNIDQQYSITCNASHTSDVPLGISCLFYCKRSTANDLVAWLFMIFPLTMMFKREIDYYIYSFINKMVNYHQINLIYLKWLVIIINNCAIVTPLYVWLARHCMIWKKNYVYNFLNEICAIDFSLNNKHCVYNFSQWNLRHWFDNNKHCVLNFLQWRHCYSIASLLP